MSRLSFLRRNQVARHGIAAPAGVDVDDPAGSNPAPRSPSLRAVAGGEPPSLFRLRPERVLKGLLVVVGVLIAAGLVADQLKHGGATGAADHFVALFHLDKEGNIPTWFASLLLFVNALALAAIAGVALHLKDRWRFFWAGLAVIFLLFSLDEAVSVHERTAVPIRDALGFGGALYYAWVLPAAACLVVFAALYFRFAMNLPRRTFWLFALAATLYVGGALGVEMIGGNYISTTGGGGPVYGLITSTEESLELLGQVVFLYALADYFRVRWHRLALRFDA